MRNYFLAFVLCSCFIFSCSSDKTQHIINEQKTDDRDSITQDNEKADSTETDNEWSKKISIKYDHHKKCFLLKCDADGRIYNSELHQEMIFEK